jgi:hypothetical protein
MPGIFWTIHNTLEAKGERLHLHFREGFGHVFEEYVGILLKRINPSTFVVQDRGSQFFDWIVPFEDGFVFVEVKGEQFGLPSRTRPEREQLEKEIVPKIIKAFVQCNRRLAEIESKSGLARFKGSRAIPCVVVWDMPLVEQGGMAKYVRNTIKRIVAGQVSQEINDLLMKKEIKLEELQDLLDKQPVLISVRELELLEGVSTKISLEDFLEKKSIDGSSGRQIIAVDVPGHKMISPYLNSKYDEYWRSVNNGKWQKKTA